MNYFLWDQREKCYVLYPDLEEAIQIIEIDLCADDGEEMTLTFILHLC